MVFLVACACPSFEEMEIVGDDDGEIALAVATFAGWTGRAGVCVPEVRVEDDVRMEGDDVDGAWLGPYGPIVVSSSASSRWMVTIHELCHALDWQEHHALDNPEVFLESDVTEVDLYASTSDRRQESFARSCEVGLWRHELSAWLDDRCGLGLLTARDRYVQDRVYTRRPPVTVSDADPIVATGAPVDLARAFGAAGVGEDLWIAGEWEDGGTIAGIVRVDATGAVLERIVLDGPSEDPAAAYLAHTDAEMVVIQGGEARIFHPGTGAVTPLGPVRSSQAAWSGGVLYSTSWSPFGTELYVLHDGVETLLATTFQVLEMQPVPGGVELLTVAGLVRYVNGGWSSVSDDFGYFGFAPWSGDQRLLVHFEPEGMFPYFLDVTTGDIAVPGCASVPSVFGDWTRVGDAVVAVSASTADVEVVWYAPG